MTHKLIIPGRLPGLNEYVDDARSNRYQSARAKHKAQVDIGRAILSQLGAVRLTEPVRIYFLWVEENKKRDKDNVAFAKKFILDALVKAGVLRNDGWKHVDSFADSFAIDKKNPRVEVTIETIENRQEE